MTQVSNNPFGATFGKGEIVVIATPRDEKEIETCLVAKIHDYYLSGTEYGYHIIILKVLKHEESDVDGIMAPPISFHEIWVERLPYQHPYLREVNQLIKGTKYARVWFNLKKRMHAVEPFTFR